MYPVISKYLNIYMCYSSLRCHNGCQKIKYGLRLKVVSCNLKKVEDKWCYELVI